MKLCEIIVAGAIIFSLGAAVILYSNSATAADLDLGGSTWVQDKYWFFEISQMHTFRTDDWKGDSPTLLSLGRMWMGKKWYVKLHLMHASNLDRGGPFNDRPESYLDMGGATLGVRW